MKEFKERLELFAKTQYNMGQTRFEDYCGLAHGTISAIKANGPSASVITRVSVKCPELNLNWLFRGSGDMIIGESENNADSPSIEVSVVKTAGSVIISDAKSLEDMIQLAVSKALQKP